MKKIILSVFALFVATLFYTNPVFADTKIGVVNMQVLLQEIPQMKKIGDNLKKQFGDRQKRLIDAQNVFKDDAEKFRRDSTVMTDKDKQAAEDKLLKQQQELQKTQSELQKDYMSAQNKEVDVLMSQIKAVVDKISVANKFDLILASAGVAYSKEELDVTNQVLKKMTEK